MILVDMSLGRTQTQLVRSSTLRRHRERSEGSLVWMRCHAQGKDSACKKRTSGMTVLFYKNHLNRAVVAT